MIIDFDNYSTEKDINIKIKLSGDFIYDTNTSTPNLNLLHKHIN